MDVKLGTRFWKVATVVIVVFTVFLVGRNAIHAVKIKRQINAMNREMEYYRTKIARDSTLVEHLKYDDYLEEYAREHFRMQRRDEHVYILED